MAQVILNPITNGEGFCQSSNQATWAAARNQGSGSSNQDIIEIYSSQTGGPIFNIIRGFLPFNTTAIPQGSIVQSATLQLYRDDTVGAFANNDTTSINLVQTAQVNTSNLAGGDYSLVTFTGGGSVNFASTSNNTYFTITFNATALGWIIGGGISKLGIITGLDLSNTSPASTNFLGMQSGTGTNKPILTVTYLPPSGILGDI